MENEEYWQSNASEFTKAETLTEDEVLDKIREVTDSMTDNKRIAFAHTAQEMLKRGITDIDEIIKTSKEIVEQLTDEELEENNVQEE